MRHKLYTAIAQLFIHLSLQAATEFTIPGPSIVNDAERIGINLGTWTTWGAEQFSKNILMNPGFEGYVDRIAVIVTQSDQRIFSDEADFGYDDDYWKGASFEIRTGPASGKKGTILRSWKKGPNGFPNYEVDQKLPLLAVKDVITITKLNNADPVPIWWIAESSKDLIHVDPKEKRPFSSGLQSLALSPKKGTAATINYYLDTIWERAGKLLPIKGKWRFSIWMKADSPNEKAHILFRRINGTQAFFEQTISLESEWKEYTFDFQPRDDGPPQSLQLTISAEGDGKVFVDDVFLGSLESGNKTAFRQPVVDALLKLKPSYIRDTEGQLGDTFENRIAEIYARRAMTTRAYAGAPSLSTGYSIPDLLQLCLFVGANPWIVIPPTFSDEEAFLLGQFLSRYANKSRFSSVIVEFGDENWNWIFRANSIPYAPQHGIIAEKIFGKIQEGAGDTVFLKKAVNGQYVNPSVSKMFIESTPNADMLVIAPYFFETFEAKASPEKNLQLLFEDDPGLMKQTLDFLKPMKKTLGVYEINLHTTKGNASGKERDVFTTSQAAGSALAKKLLEAMLLSIQPQIVFSLSQFDSSTEDGKNKVRLWGITRDLGETKRFRPQGLAVVMLNATIGGKLFKLVPKSSTPILGVAFKKDDLWKAAIVNGSPSPQEGTISFPGGALPNQLWSLNAKSPFDTNENQESVTISRQPLTSKNNVVSFKIPAWGFIVLTNEGKKP